MATQLVPPASREFNKVWSGIDDRSIPNDPTGLVGRRLLRGMCFRVGEVVALAPGDGASDRAAMLPIRVAAHCTPPQSYWDRVCAKAAHLESLRGAERGQVGVMKTPPGLDRQG